MIRPKVFLCSLTAALLIFATGFAKAEGVLGLDLLWAEGGHWVPADLTHNLPAGSTCADHLASESLGRPFWRYDPNRAHLKTRLGGKHPHRHDAGVQKAINVTQAFPMHLENISRNGPIIEFDMFTTVSGSIIGEKYEMDLDNRTLQVTNWHTCRNCQGSQVRIFERREGQAGETRVWCTGEPD